MWTLGGLWMGVGTSVGSIMFLYTMIQQFVPHQLRHYMVKYLRRLMGYTNPYIQISIDEFTGERLKLSEAYTSIEAYLSSKTSKMAKRLKAQVGKDSKNLVLSMDEYEEMTDEFQEAKLWWSLSKTTPKTQQFSFYPVSDEKRYLTLQFHRRHREIVTGLYLNHVIEESKAIMVQNRQRKLYTNNPSHGYYGYRRTPWSHVVFDHPGTFDHLAMDPAKKKEIVDDLITFSSGKEYYAKIGKPWKRGYLLYGPPGTGKSTMIAAMANLLNYDIYDLELTAVKENSELRKLLGATSNKSIIVIEDIDCSLDLTGQRKDKNKEEAKEENPIPEKAKEEKESKVTLSGLLNFIDGLWSACGKERLIVFTTNYVEKLDPALIRRGRMDKHIEMAYCGFEGFKILAKNYLDLDSHYLFETIKNLIDETQMIPADVAENLMPKTINWDFETCLKNLIQALGKAKEDARLKAEEEAKEKEILNKSGEVKEGDLSTKGETKEDGTTRSIDK
ncbi:AAA+ ATPase domain [Macleaya cordata]|uniref:AAA+ ATPase domain n=1 Tax=Macleaya cordata TaxID=56857 RepID=A0A200QXR8_MACCD|nr:AAA+ ATPase domain [Macleaya cordata]